MTCFSCAKVLNTEQCADPYFASLHNPSCKRAVLTTSAGQVPNCLLSLRLLPFAIAQAALLACSILLFSLTWESRAHIFYAFLIVTTGINFSCLNAVRELGSSMTSILKGGVNFLFPLLTA